MKEQLEVIEYFNANDFVLSEQPRHENKKSFVVKAYWKGTKQDIILKFSVIDSVLAADYKSNFKRISGLNHPNIICHYQIWDLDRSFFPFTLVEALELANRGSLSNHLKNICNAGLLLGVLKDVFVGLHDLHTFGIMHRDIKASNILLVQNKYKLSAKISDIEFLIPIINNTKVNMTTPEFLAPEVVDYDTYDVRSETWAVGVMLYEIFVGKFPFGSRLEGLSIDTIRERSRNMEPDSLEKIPIAYREMVKICLNKSESNRPDSFSSLVEMLKPFSILKVKLKEIWNSK